MSEIIMRKISDIADLLNGYAFKSQNYVDFGIRVIRIANVQDGHITDEQPCFYPIDTIDDIKKYVLQEGDLLVSLTGNVGRIGILKAEMLPAALNQRVSCIRLNDSTVNRQYLYYYLWRKEFIRDCVKASRGVAQLNLSTKWLEQYQIPVLPLSEQNRIVSRIEELFSQLDNGAKTLQTVKQQLTAYRQAVLKEAFEGRLTVEWRNNNTDTFIDDYWKKICELKQASGNNQKFRQDEAISLATLPQNWKWVSIGDITSGVEYGTSQKSLKGGKVPVVRMGNIQNGSIDWADLSYSNDNTEIEKYLLSKNDVLFNRTNSPELVGKTAIYRGELKSIFAGYLIRINQFDCINAEYLTYYLNSYTAKYYGNKVKTDGVNQSNINGKKLCSYPFPLCTLEEQKQVVFELESRLSICDSIEQTVDTVLQQAEALRQSILKEAFGGRLN